MSIIKRLEDLEIWQLAGELENKVVEETQKGKLAKDYKLKDQINNSSGSIMDNIAEGFGKGSRLEFVQFLSISKGSANELQSQLYRSFDRKYISKEMFDELYNLADKCCSKIHSFMDYLNRSDIKGQKFVHRINLK